MKAKSTHIDEVDEIILPWGRGFSSKWRGEEAITLRTDAFEIVMYEKGIRIHYTIFRNHDHDNVPSIFFELPEGGCVKEYENTAKLTVQSDSGHLNLEMLYDDYVWERGLKLVVKKYEYEELRNIYKNKGLDALLNHLNITVEGKQS